MINSHTMRRLPLYTDKKFLAIKSLCRHFRGLIAEKLRTHTVVLHVQWSVLILPESLWKCHEFLLPITI